MIKHTQKTWIEAMKASRARFNNIRLGCAMCTLANNVCEDCICSNANFRKGLKKFSPYKHSIISCYHLIPYSAGKCVNSPSFKTITLKVINNILLPKLQRMHKTNKFFKQE